MSSAGTNSSNNSIANAHDDEILDMFFDEEFVPQAYVDILLSSTDPNDINQLHTISSSLLTRLDFYTKSLTSELENTIWNLEKLSETLPGTGWSSRLNDNSNNDDNIDDDYTKNSINDGNNNDDSLEKSSLTRSRSTTTVGTGISKLEYYLDTLGSSVKALETDLNKVETDLNELNKKSIEGENVLHKLRNLELIKKRLNNVLQIFITIRNIIVISEGDVKDIETSNTAFTDFKLSLSTLQDTIVQTLRESLEKENEREINKDIIKKIEKFSELAPVFKGLEPFHKEYLEFSENIKRQAQEYLSEKDIIDDPDMGI